MAKSMKHEALAEVDWPVETINPEGGIATGRFEITLPYARVEGDRVTFDLPVKELNLSGMHEILEREGLTPREQDEVMDELYELITTKQVTKLLASRLRRIG